MVFLVSGIGGSLVIISAALIAVLVAVDKEARLYSLLALGVYALAALAATGRHFAESNMLTGGERGQLVATLEKTSASFALALVGSSLALLLMTYAMTRLSKSSAQDA